MEEVTNDVQWFRWWHDSIEDEKLFLLSFQHRWLWTVVLTLASKSPKRGYLYVSEHMPHTVEQIAAKARLSVPITKAGLELMKRQDFSMVGYDGTAWFVTNWEKRQPVRDDVTERVRKHRERVTCNALSNAEETPSDTDTDNTPYSPPEGGGYPERFEVFWGIYPLKKEKGVAYEKWRILRRKGVHSERLIRCATNYASECRAKNREPEYIKHGSTFLMKERWMEYEEPVAVDKVDFAPVQQPKSAAVSELERLLAEGDANG